MARPHIPYPTTRKKLRRVCQHCGEPYGYSIAVEPKRYCTTRCEREATEQPAAVPQADGQS